MKYVKTFENFSQEMDSQMSHEHDIDMHPSSPELKQILSKLADEKGLDVEEVIDTQEEILKDPIKTNEEEEPFTLVSAALLVLGPLVIGGLGYAHSKIRENKNLKRYVMDKAEEKVKEMVKKDPKLVDNMENLVSQAYDEMMADREFINNVKSSVNLQAYGSQRGREFSATAGYL